jgi:DNA-binding transcriptional LysR family regulator
MKLGALHALVAVVERGSFVAAAADMKVTPSAVSLQMKQLEAWFGRPLFDRSGRTAGVTPLAREIAGAVLEAPADPGAARMARSITAGLLPPRLREAFGLAWDAECEARLDALVESVHSLRGGAAAAGGRA